MEPLIMYCPESYIEQHNLFFGAYQLKEVIACGAIEDTQLKSKLQRVCRFCCKKYPEVTFRQEAHRIPEMLGNKKMLSDFECDSCNEIFKKYENDLANFLGPSRAIQGIQGKKGSPKFVNPDKNMRIEKSHTDFLGEVLSIGGNEMGENPINNLNTNSVSFTKHSYVPLRAYKAVLKMALSCLSETDIINYDITKKYLLSNKLDNNVGGCAHIYAYQIPFGMGYESPNIFLFEKKKNELELPSHIFLIYFGNLIYQIFLPLHRKDLHLYNGKTLTLYWCPPLYPDLDFIKNTNILSCNFDMNGTTIIKGEKEILNYEIPNDAKENSILYNLNTGEVTKDLSQFLGVKKIYLVKNGAIFKLSNKDNME